MIIDFHTHIFPDVIRRDQEAFCRKDRSFSSIYSGPKARTAGARELIASMDDSEVDQAVVCGFPWDDLGLCHLHNEYLFESASEYPDRLIVFPCIPFSDPDGSGRELEWALTQGAQGIGEIGFYVREMTSTDIQLMREVLILMADRGLPLLLHTNETLGHSYPGKGSTPLDRFYELIRLFPRLRIVLAHWGGGLPFFELMPEVAKSMANVYYDTAASPFLFSSRIYAAAALILGAEKILFGTDFPLLKPARYLRDMEESGLSEQDRKKILGLNARILLRL
jgi:uncharacterized protein